ncbi:uncharacterized protein LOC110020930 [Phalaenopsis equestris]|uniref:uncharacterized protein LOC110020930 n=1 Tax=Phalaenopsis equestris TaxID=78828 RepID=UPI0009E4AE2D|nr:uncharacterized protein LOC110020930 [Phalaenopsis equestris]
MDGKRLDLDAPLLSFRRITVPGNSEEVSLPPPLRRNNTLPFHNSELKFGQVAVPFEWEKKPGQPKDSSVAITKFEVNPAVPKLPPGRSFKESGVDWANGASLPPESETVVGALTSVAYSSGWRDEKEKGEDEEESYSTVCDEEDDAFSDARDAFSCADSFSVSAGAGGKDSLRRFTKDLQLKEFMMDRFLPAAQAMAENSSQRTWRKPSRAKVDEGENSGSQTIRRSRFLRDYQYHVNRAQLHGIEQEEEGEEEYDDDYGSFGGSGFFSSKACGLIQRFCLKNPVGPLNSVPGLKSQGRPQQRNPSRRSQINVLHHASLGQAEEEDSWEAVYRYKLNRGYYPHRNDGSKLICESNQLTSWSDSQMFDGSSFFNTTDKHEDSKRESGSWKTGSSDQCERVNESYWETTYVHGRLQGSGSTSPATERPLTQNSLSLPETPDCKLAFANIASDTKTVTESAGNSSAVEDEFQLTEESFVSETSEGYALQSRSSKIAEPGFSLYCGRLNGVETHEDGYDNSENKDDEFTLKVDLLEKKDDSLALCLFPPLLPTSPSDSWLQRTLPSVSSKGQHQQSFLGILNHPKRRASLASSGGHKSVTYGKPSNLHPR